MKTIQTTLKGLIPVLAFSIVLASCSKEDNLVDPNEEGVHYATMGDATGAQMEPPVATPGTASMVGTYNTGNNKWEYSVNWTNLSSDATAIEIHGPGTEGPNSTRIFTEVITNGDQNGARSVTVTLSEEQEKPFLEDSYSFRILTTAYPAGEIRGQIITITR
jgi:hypothetical protein